MQFEKAGIIGPVTVLTGEECLRMKALLQSAPAPVDWGKGHAANSAAFHQIASNPAIVDRVAEIVGGDVMLWGSSLITKKPGQEHPWHTDIETSADNPGTVTVWMGLENTNRESSLRLIPGSHLFGITIQERAAIAGKRRNEVTVEDVLSWAREFDPRCDLVQLDMTDGDAVLFDGRVWHGSLNTRQEGVRTAVLLQYATPERGVRIPDFSRLDYPFQWYDEPRPPCVMVRGVDRTGRNRIVPGPESDTPAQASCVRRLRFPLAEDERTGWKRYPIRQGPTQSMSNMSCHASVLSPGKTPHKPHSHLEEEILIMLDGEAELVIVDAEGTTNRHPVRPGDFAYYESGQMHTIRNRSTSPATYLMFKWRNTEVPGRAERLPSRIFRYDMLAREAIPEPGKKQRMRRVFEGRTTWLRKLHCHTTTLLPGAGYEPHSDPYDVAILILAGTVDTIGQRLEPHDVVFYAAGESHGMRNVGEISAAYLVFEFHGDAAHD